MDPQFVPRKRGIHHLCVHEPMGSTALFRAWAVGLGAPRLAPYRNVVARVCAFSDPVVCQFGLVDLPFSRSPAAERVFVRFHPRVALAAFVTVHVPLFVGGSRVSRKATIEIHQTGAYRRDWRPTGVRIEIEGYSGPRFYYGLFDTRMHPVRAEMVVLTTGSCRVYCLHTGRQVCRLPGALCDTIADICSYYRSVFSVSGERVAVVMHNKIRVYEAANGYRFVCELTADGNVHSCSFSGPKRFLFVTTRALHTVCMWEPGRPVKHFRVVGQRYIQVVGTKSGDACLILPYPGMHVLRMDLADGAVTKAHPVSLEYDWNTLFRFGGRPFCAHFTDSLKNTDGGKLMCYELDPESGLPLGAAMGATVPHQAFSIDHSKHGLSTTFYRINPIQRVAVCQDDGTGAVAAGLRELHMLDA